jgi:hypothetical protein
MVKETAVVRARSTLEFKQETVEHADEALALYLETFDELRKSIPEEQGQTDHASSRYPAITLRRFRLCTTDSHCQSPPTGSTRNSRRHHLRAKRGRLALSGRRTRSLYHSALIGYITTEQAERQTA